MKLRSLLLVSCMLVVPSLAMFSHLIPAEFRAACRRSVGGITSGWLGTPAESHAVPPATVAFQSAADQPDEPLVTDQSVRVTPVSTLPAQTATALPPAATGGPPVSAGLLPIEEAPAATTNPAVPPLVAQLADRTRNVRDQQAREQLAIETQLKAVGALSFDCQPLPGSEGLYSSSCRVPVDATGQLQRVFQGTGPDPGSASAALLEQVLAWQQRVALPPQPAAEGGTSSPGDRFR
jgi:hypothetical protein